jgi:DNA-binding SARP family transcriptional activator
MQNDKIMQKKTKFKLSLFGGFQLTDIDGQLIDPGPRKVKALLAWLAVNPDIEHPREKVAAMFWPDSEEDVARHSLRQALASLRKVMPDEISPLKTSKGSILLDRTKIEVDALAFEAALAVGEVRASEEITQLYQGEFLAGCNPKADLFEDWLRDHRHHYRERAVNAMCQRLTVLIDTRKFKQAVPVAVRLINIDPLRESAYRGLMMAYQAMGNHALALRWYHRCEAVLLRELAVLPCLETRALHAQLLAARDQKETETDTKIQSADLKLKKATLDLISKGNQRVLYQAESIIEGILDRLGGQSVLLRGESTQAKQNLLAQITALAEPQGFEVCRGMISAKDDGPDQQATPCTHISSCLALTSDVERLSEQERAQQLEECFSSIKAVADVSPVLLIIENIHASGRRTLELLARLISAVGEASVLLVMTSAYGGENREKAWQGAMLNAPLTTIDLR